MALCAARTGRFICSPKGCFLLFARKIVSRVTACVSDVSQTLHSRYFAYMYVRMSARFSRTTRFELKLKISYRGSKKSRKKRFRSVPFESAVCVFTENSGSFSRLDSHIKCSRADPIFFFHYFSPGRRMTRK